MLYCNIKPLSRFLIRIAYTFIIDMGILIYKIFDTHLSTC